MKETAKEKYFESSDTDDAENVSNLSHVDSLEEVQLSPFRTSNTKQKEHVPTYPFQSSSSRRHSSVRAKHFLKHCKKKVIKKPLTATFHLCRVETNKSLRKLSLRTRRVTSVSSCSTISSSSANSSCESATNSDDCVDIDQVNDDINKLQLEESCKKTISDFCLEKRSDLYSSNMGCNTSTIHPQDENHKNSSFDDDVDDINRDDVGMTTKSNADLLEAHRIHSTDVTRGLEDRWLRSHFSEQVLTKSDSRAKRRKMSCFNNSDGSRIDPTIIGFQHAAPDSEIEMHGGELSDVKDVLSIIHFNDVYEISERKKEPIGGASRFSALVNSKISDAMADKSERPLVVFSGDCLNPSTLSCATQGRHMVEVLNHLKVDVAVFGNHEFDFGVEHAAKCIKEMKAPWLLGNVTDKLTNRNLAEGLSTWTTTRQSGLKVGFIGLVEEEWLDTLATVDRSNLEYHDYVQRGKVLAKQLREDGVDFVIALTHMRWPNDIRLAREVPDIDLVLGGHDHEYGVKDVDECLIIKSGSDFRNFSSVDIFIRVDGCVDVRLVRHDVTNSVLPDVEMDTIVRRYMEALEKSLEACIGTIGANLNGKFKVIRSQETTLGNFVADIMATVTKADIVLINSGTFRSDAVHTSGDFRLHDLMTILPINDTVVTIVVTGQQLLDALENGVSKVPKLEGRFPHVSGIVFAFNPSCKPGSRVIAESIRIRGEPLDLDRDYRLATKAYVARGKDGYTCLSKCKILTDPDSGPLLSTVVRNHIMNVKRLMDFEKSRSCQIYISSDGRGITCSESGIDVSQAFKDCSESEAPVHMIQKCMKPVIDGNNNTTDPSSPVGILINDEAQKPIHLPNFITIPANVDPTKMDLPVPEPLALLRKAAQMADDKNAQLLLERTQTPTDLRWQITPLLEARIFKCKVSEDSFK